MENKFAKGFQKRFKKFASETSMHGFKDLSSSKHISSTLFWLTMLIFAACMTGMHLSETVRNFSERKTTMMIQPARKDEEILYPPLRLCYPHWLHWVDFKLAESLGFTKRAMLYALAYLDRVYSCSSEVDMVACQAYQEFVDAMKTNKFKNLSEFFLSIVRRETMNKFIAFGNHNMLDFLPHMYYDGASSVLCQTASESAIASDFRKLEADSKKQVKIFNIKKQIFRDVQEAVNEDEYYFYMSEWTKFHMGNRASYARGDENVSMALTFCPLGYGGKHSCFKILSSVRQYFVLITFHGNVYKWKNTRQSPCLEKINRISPNDTCSNLCVKYRHKILPTTKLPVEEVDFSKYTQHDIKVCPDAFTGDSIEQKNCFPENATKNSLKKKATWKEVGPEIEECLKTCVKGCNEYRHTYTFQQENFEESAVDVSHRATNIIIEYEHYQDILVMTEEDLQTWENFVGNVGGLLGIWTGASVLSFIQTIYFCCSSSAESCLMLCSKQKARGNLQTVNLLTVESGQVILTLSNEEGAV